jgi:hypothetical protein
VIKVIGIDPDGSGTNHTPPETEIAYDASLVGNSKSEKEITKGEGL